MYFAMPTQILIELFFGCCDTEHGPDEIWGKSARQPIAAWGWSATTGEYSQ
jgi:hypothetical protein